MSISETNVRCVEASSPERTARAERILARCREIAACTEIPGQITRTFLSPPTRRVHELLRDWMDAAGMTTTVDAIGNLRGVNAVSRGRARRIILASHLDTVPNAGAFDGVLGVVMAVAAVEALQDELPVTIEIIGFSEEEGVRFRKPFLGSLAAVGELDAASLAFEDAQGKTVADAIRDFGLDPACISHARLAPDAIAYLEVHIEQGPVLACAKTEESATPGAAAAEKSRSVLGVVDAIVGQSRLLLTFHGQANHAGTTPMHLRHDALAAAAEWLGSLEAIARQTPGLVATAGQIQAEPGAANIIPGLVRVTLDVRHANDAVRKQAVNDLIEHANAAASTRGVRVTNEVTFEQGAVQMDANLVRLLEDAVARAGHTTHVMPSGAGHDAMIIAPHVPSVMLFLPTPGGLSHHPDESVLAADVEAALDTMLEFLRLVSHDEVSTHA